MELILALAVIVLVVIVGVLLVTRNSAQVDPEKVLNKLYEKNEELRTKNKDEVNTSVKDMLDGNQKQIDTIIKQLHTQLKDGQGDVKSLKEQNAALGQAIRNTNEMTKELKTSADSLKNLLSNNRLRGEWGEQVAENLLLQSGFVENTDYLKQKATVEGRPDFTLLFPDGSKLNIDVKFAYDHLQTYQAAQENQDKEGMKRALKDFENSIKTKIKGITSKDYISPQSDTLDFVVMFIPNEMIFSFIYEKIPSIIEACAKNKVLMTGPFGFTALLRLVRQAHRNFRYQSGLKEILGYVEQFREEYEKFGGKLGQLGNQLETVQKTYRDVEGTRSRRLTRVVDKIGEYSQQEKLLADEKQNVEVEALDVGQEK